MSDLNAALQAIAQHSATVAQAQQDRERGLTGPRGPIGEIGRPATLVIGTVTSGDRAAASFSDTKVPGEFALNLTLPRGAEGPCGEPGVGLTGPAGPVAQITIGRVVAGDKAAAQLRQDGDTYTLDLVLPRGDRGPAGKDSTVAGPRGEAGLPGRDSKVPGPAGESIVGPVGPKGEPGMSIDEIQQTIIQVLTDSGVITEQAKKLVQIRTLLKKKALQADSRHAFEMGELVRSVDKLFDAE